MRCLGQLSDCGLKMCNWRPREANALICGTLELGLMAGDLPYLSPKLFFFFILLTYGVGVSMSQNEHFV